VSPAVSDRLDQQRCDCRIVRLSHLADLHVPQLLSGALKETSRILEGCTVIKTEASGDNYISRLTVVGKRPI
jgi:hypothetical protein